MGVRRNVRLGVRGWAKTSRAAFGIIGEESNGKYYDSL